MRSSPLPTLALAVLMLAAGSFGTWYMLTYHAEPSRTPPAPAASPEPEPASTVAARPGLEPVVDRPAEPPLQPARPGPALTEPAVTPVPKPDAKPEIRPAGPDTVRPALADEEKAKHEEIRRKLEEELKRARERMPNLPELPRLDEVDELKDLLGGPQVDFTATLRGMVVDGAGAPVAGASIYADYSETLNRGDGEMRRVSIVIGRSGEDAGTPIATTGPDGTFSAAVQRTAGEKSSVTANLTAKAEGYADSRVQRVPLRNGEEKEGIRLVLRGAGSVSGRVVDASGRGVEGIKVRFAGDGTMSYGVVEGVEFPDRGGKEAVTDAAGAFQVTGLAEGRYRPRLSATGWRQVSGPTEVTVKAGAETRCAADFVVAASSAIRVTLQNAEGKPLQGFVSVRIKD
ncbi:MAG: carboxypeptidase regulatory-like domain-containing protein, partial [Planctomycetes bacterium]|nr:carboxypeptidase regulatory-like domain-containing protein [Planctomycetota bacterium]